MSEKFVNMVSEDGSMKSRVGKTAFGKVWSKKGWKLDAAEVEAPTPKPRNESKPAASGTSKPAEVEPSGSEGDN